MILLLQMLTDAVLIGSIWMLGRELRKVREQNRSLTGKFKALLTTTEKQINTLVPRIEELEHGLNPNYEAAKKANDALNDFNKGVAAILGFDPYAALHKDDLKDE